MFEAYSFWDIIGSFSKEKSFVLQHSKTEVRATHNRIEAFQIKAHGACEQFFLSSAEYETRHCPKQK